MKRSANQSFVMDFNGSSSSTFLDDSNSNKKGKFESCGPSRVLHIRGVPSETQDAEIIQLGLPFGRMTNLVIARRKNQALLEMADVSTAEQMLNYYTERPPQIRNNTVFFQYSRHEQLKTDGKPDLNAGTHAALQAAEKRMGGGSGSSDETRTVLRVIIENMLYPITLDVLRKIFSKYGNVLKIVTYTKNDHFQAFIQLSDALSANTALESLNGQNIYNGCCTLRLDYSKLQTLTVKFNNERMWDYTNPDLPSGHQTHQQHHKSIVENAGLGLLGSFGGSGGGGGGSFGFGGLNSLGGGGGMSKIGGMPGLSGLGGMGIMGGMGGMGPMGGLGNMGGMGNMGSMGGIGGLGPMGGIGGIGGMGALGVLGGMGGMGGGNMDAMMGGGGGGQGPLTNSVLIVSNLSEEKANPDVIFTLFGVYGTVNRVKVLYNKKDTALVQFADGIQAQNAMNCLDKLLWCGKNLKVSLSKHNHIQMPKEGQSEGWLTKDYSNSPHQRFKNPNSKNASNVNPPSATLHISNLPSSATEEQLMGLFGQYGRVIAFKFLPKDKKMALIKMESTEAAVEGLVCLHNTELEEKYHMRVSFTKSMI